MASFTKVSEGHASKPMINIKIEHNERSKANKNFGEVA